MSNHLDVRRSRTADAWGLHDEIVLIGAGEPIGKPGGADQTYPYIPHSEYRWLTDRRREGGVLAYDPHSGWELFEPVVTEMEKVWGGGDPPIGRPLEELQGWLSARQGRPLAGLGTYDGTADATLSERLRETLSHVRRVKDEAEVVLGLPSAEATAAGFAAATQFIRPGVTERQIQIELEAAMTRAGADGPGYATIVGTGPNCAVFHFTPGARVVEAGDFVLIDAGAEVNGYVADVTRTFSGAGKFSPEERDIYEAVLEMQRAAIDLCRPGTEWLAVHEAAARSLARSLRDLGLISCEEDQAIESGLVALFFPHGVGHMVGLGVRDASGPLPGRAGDSRSAGVRVRMDLPLEENYLVTVEPGLYFSPAILDDPTRREKFATIVNWDQVTPWIGRGGVRIEDDILITAQGPVNLTEAIPK